MWRWLRRCWRRVKIWRLERQASRILERMIYLDRKRRRDRMLGID